MLYVYTISQYLKPCPYNLKEYTENMTIPTLNKLLDIIMLKASWTTGLILGLRPANDRRRYKVTPSPIGWAQT